MIFTTQMAEHRFGYGRSLHVTGPASVSGMLAALAGPDRMAEAIPQPIFSDLQAQFTLWRRFRGYARKNPETEEGMAADAKQAEVFDAARADWEKALTRLLARRAETEDAFRERLVAFWGDHFTARGKYSLLRFALPHYLEEAVRPHVAGRFGDLLAACVMHPLMLHYLDQDSSVGPNSIMVRRRNVDRGLNENLARELLELHTLGAGGPFTQQDVRQLAELLTGLSRTRDYSFVFRRHIAEPGPETVLGKTYGKGASPQYVRAVLQDLSVHPATAAHLARKLAVHFVSDDPPPDLVRALEEAYRDSGGELMRVYEVLLSHPESWREARRNMRPPEEYISAALRGLGLGRDALAGLDQRDRRRNFIGPLRVMGQPWQGPTGPDGWAEEDAAWITPQGIATRLDWAMRAPGRLMDDLPDPAAFLETALGDAADERLRIAVGAAENRAVGIGLVLSAPAFQRR